MSHSKIPIIRRVDSNSDITGNELNNPSSGLSNETPFKMSTGYNGGGRSSGQQMKNLSPPNMNLSPNYRQMMHRPSVRSISETPNVIGAQANQYHNDLCSIILTCLSWFLVVLFFPLSLSFLFRVIQEYERGIKHKLSFNLIK